MTEDEKTTWYVLVGVTVVLLALLAADLSYHQIVQGSWRCTFIRCVQLYQGNDTK